MRSYISYDELEELGETIVRAYINKTRRYNALCVDIEGLVTDYLGLTVVYETIVEDDLNKIAFLSNGKRPLRVVRDGKRVEVIFPKNTVVLDKVLLNEKESSRRRFTLGHEGAHSIIAKQNPMQDVGCFHNTFDPERQYTLEERRELLSFSEAQADRLWRCHSAKDRHHRPDLQEAKGKRRRGTHVACGEQPSGHRYS